MQSSLTITGPCCLITTRSKYARKSDRSFHLELLECLDDAVVSSPKERFFVNKYGLILATGFKKVSLQPQKADGRFRLIQLDVAYPAPLNQYLMADNALIHDLMNDQEDKSYYIVFHLLSDLVCHNYLNLLDLLSQAGRGDAYDDFQSQRLFGLLCTELLHHYQVKINAAASTFPVKQIRHAGPDTQAGAILTYLTGKNGQASLREAAAYFGYQPNYFSRLCRKLFGHDFVHLRIRIRMNIAENELRLTNKRLEEISSELGYQDVANFSKAFSQLKGITPGAFRKKYGIKKAR